MPLTSEPTAINETISWLIPIVSIVVSVALGALSGWIAVLLKMAKYQEKVDAIKETLEKISTKVDHLRTDVDTLKEFKVNAQKFIDRALYKSESPLALTDVGKKLVKDSGFETIFATQKDELAKMLFAKSPKTKYDAQEKARELLDSLTNYQPFMPIKFYAFKTGTDFGQILRAGAILLRDYYYSIHPELTD